MEGRDEIIDRTGRGRSSFLLHLEMNGDHTLQSWSRSLSLSLSVSLHFTCSLARSDHRERVREIERERAHITLSRWTVRRERRGEVGLVERSKIKGHHKHTLDYRTTTV